MELIIVVVIIGLLAAIAIPRFSRGAANTNVTAFAGDMAVLRNALELYAVEHAGDYPSQANFVDQLTRFSNDAGLTSNTRSDLHPLGPYLVAVPELKVGDHRGNAGIAAVSGVPQAESAISGVGWLYDEVTGQIWPNDSNNF